MPCYLCNAIKQNVRGANGGDHLVPSAPAEVSTHGGGTVTVTHFKCSECGTRWRYVDDPDDPSSGWAFIRRDR